MHITDIKVNDDHKSAIFVVDKVDIFEGFPLHETTPFGFTVMVYLSGTVFPILPILRSITASIRSF